MAEKAYHVTASATLYSGSYNKASQRQEEKMKKYERFVIIAVFSLSMTTTVNSSIQTKQIPSLSAKDVNAMRQTAVPASHGEEKPSGTTLQPHQPSTNKFFAVRHAIEGQYMVVLPAETQADAVPILAAALTKKYGGRVTHQYIAAEGSLRGFALSGLTLWRARSLASDPRVKFVEQVALVLPAGKRTNPGWALDRIDQRSNTLNGVYRYSSDGEGVRVYILDTGIDTTHQEFSYPPVEFGTDTTGGTGAPCDGHGTAMASLIAGRTKGVAPAATLVNVKVLNCSLIGNSTANIVAGIVWVTQNARLPAVANLSLQLQRGATSQTMRKAIEDLLNRDVLVVVAAGNDNDDVAQVEPANYPGVIAVGASTLNGSRWVNTGSPSTGCSTGGGCGSNFGSAVTIFAPGAGVVTANRSTGGYSIADPGTSSATAIVSGVAAATLQVIWRPLQPGVGYFMTPMMVARRLILLNATEGVLSDVRTSGNRLVFAETWPISVGRFQLSSFGGLTSVSNKNGSSPSVFVSGGSRTRFDETPASIATPYAAEAYDSSMPRWMNPVNMSDGSCADVYDAGISHIWLACTSTTTRSLTALVRVVSVYDGTQMGQVVVGQSAAMPCTLPNQPHSIARVVRVDNTTGAVYVAGEAWCGTGPRTAFLASLDTPAQKVLWEKRIFDQGTKSSGAFALAVGNGVITVAGHQTLNTPGALRTAHMQNYSPNTGMPLGPGTDLNGPSTANAISIDEGSGDLYMGATRESGNGNVGVVVCFNSGLTKIWERNLDGANVFGVEALKDGVIAAGGTRRFLPQSPAISQPFQLVGLPMVSPSQGDRGFLMRLDTGGALRWTHYVDGGSVTGIAIQDRQELGDDVFIHAVGADLPPPCIAPPGVHCFLPPLTSFVESFKLK
jgi:hypothetical protein